MKDQPSEKIREKFFYIEFMYLDLKESPMAKLFWPIFIARRLALSSITVFLSDFQAIQINLLIVQSFFMLRYITRV
jgi:hypothetical protein